jgi:hypothetical protein
MSTAVAVLSPSTVRFTPTGLEVTGKLSIEEWESIAPELGRAQKTLAFAIGDWLCYGESHFEYENPVLPGIELSEEREANPRARIPGEMMQRASILTNLDVRTLQTHAMVARNVPKFIRTELLDHEHHRIVASLPHEDQRRWLSTASTKHLSSRKLRAFVQAGRELTDEEMEHAPDTSEVTHLTGIKYMHAWWRSVRGDWESRDEASLATIRQDFERLRPMLEAVGLFGQTRVITSHGVLSSNLCKDTLSRQRPKC